jgi:hypothetical protein
LKQVSVSEFSLKMLPNDPKVCYNFQIERGEIRQNGRDSVACPSKVRDSLIAN